MRRMRKIIIGVVVFTFLFNISFFNIVLATEELPAPVIVTPNESTITGKVKPTITGLTKSGTSVYVYIDGKYNGKTEILNDDSGTANFSYRPFLNLSVGSHSIYAIAGDNNGRKSEPSPAVNFNVELPFPAPTLFAPVVNKNTTVDKPFIVGLAKNNSIIRVFIDQKLFGEFKVNNDESGTADFAYLPFVGLTSGEHLVYTTAIDERGKESIWSNIIYFNVGPARQPKISAAAAEEKCEGEGDECALDKPEVLGTEFTPGDEAPGTGSSSVGGIIDEVLKDKRDTAAPGGLIDENRIRQGKINLNLVIFLLFLLAIIGWIFWVNREIIAEKRAEAGKEKEIKQ